MNKYIFVLLLLMSSSAKAGIINTLPEILDGTDSRLKLDLITGIDWQTGNNDVLDITTGSAIHYREQDGFNLYLVSKYVRNGNASGSNVSDHSVMTHIRLRHLGTKSLGLTGFEIFMQHEWDEFRNLDSRVLAGAGPIIRIVNNNKTDMVFGTSFMLEHLDKHTPNGYEFNKRSSNYIQLQINPSDNLSIQESVFFQFKFDDLNDYMTLNDLSMEVDALDWLSVRLAFTVAYDSKPPFGIKHLDTAFVSGIVINYEHN